MSATVGQPQPVDQRRLCDGGASGGPRPQRASAQPWRSWLWPWTNARALLAGIAKLGRTQLQDAVPMTLGQEFAAFATTLREDVQRAGETARLMLEVNLGGTAIGTGIARISRPTASTRCSAPGSPIARCWAMPWPAPPKSGAWNTRTNTARSSNRPCRPGGPVPTCRVAFRGLVRRSRSSSFRTQ